MPTPLIEARLQAETPSGLANLLATDARELRVADADVQALLASILTELGQQLEAGGTVALDATTLAALETVNAVVSGTVAVNNFPATQPVSATDLDIRNLAVTDKVTAVDAAELTGMLYEPINFATSGAHTIVAVAPGARLRLRRFLPTGGDPDAEPPSNPVLTVTLGGVNLRSTILIGRFDILGGDGEDLVVTSSKAGQVDGTVGYVIE